jgi:hypothetical protein
MTAKTPKKKAAKAPTAGKTGSKTASARVTVRMFCQGLGDCFLITAPQAGSRPYSILIDCGVAMGTPQADAIMQTVVKEIEALTDGLVDLLVVTHQHWDHVSGFVQAAQELGSITFKRLWLAWTEDPKDDLANDLRTEFAKAKVALDHASKLAAQFSATDPASKLRLEALQGVMAFFGPAASAGAKVDIAAAMAAPAKLVGGKEAIDYLLPGTCRTLPGSPSGLAGGIQAFVMGPPHERAKLIKINPSKAAPETFEKKKGDPPGLALNWGWTASAAAAAGGSDTDTALESEFARSQPFDRKSGIPFEAAKSDPFFQKAYFDVSPEAQGRRIDGDWLWSGAQRLALRMDTYTNNTSLVLAFELPATKQILLFAADAQVGNWLSWHEHSYRTTDGRTLSATDLLANTRLYKVGHHGSHNATLEAKGLDLMTHSGLVAMLPVEAAAVTRLGYGQMPLGSLMTALRKKTSGRILRIDDSWTDDTTPPGTWDGPGATARRAARQFATGNADGSSARNLYMELAIDDR